MENEDLIKFINDCNNLIKNTNSDLLYEVVFIKIYVKFEKFLSNMFINYSIGKSSSKGYKPDRKLMFVDEQHLYSILKDNRSYVDYIEKIKKISNQIFYFNPFFPIIESADYADYFNKMTVLRNYIAHESEESKKKYIKICLNQNNYIEPYDYLKKMNKKYSIPNYSVFINKIIEVSELICNPII